MRDAFVEQLHSLASADPRIVLLTADLGFGVLTDFQKSFPDKTAGEEPVGDGVPLEVGKARCLREGTDATIVAMGGILGEAQAAASELAQQGVSCRVLSMCP